MQIFGNILICLMLPVTLLATTSLRATFRTAGPDIIGPSFFMAIAVGMRWLLAAIVIGLCAARGEFDALVPYRASQFVLIAALFFATDFAASMAITAASRYDARLAGWQEPLAAVIGFVLPVAMVLLLLIPINAPSASSPGIERAVAAGLLVISVLATIGFGAIDDATMKRKYDKIDAARAAEQQVVDAYMVKVNAIPAAAPLEDYLPYIAAADCPDAARSLILERWYGRPDFEEQMVRLLRSERREAALYLASQAGRLYEPAQVAALVDAGQRIAESYRNRFDKRNEALANECSQSAELTLYFAQARVLPGVDFHPPIEAWRQTLTHVQPVTDRIYSVKLQIDQWLEWNPKPPAAVERH